MKLLYSYESATGTFSCEGVAVCDGYSGWGAGRDNPDLESKRQVGPIPRGCYMIGQPHFSQAVGPVAMHLTPIGHAAHGRSALMIHGDNSRRDASRGCIILPRVVRDQIAATWCEMVAKGELLGLEVI